MDVITGILVDELEQDKFNLINELNVKDLIIQGKDLTISALMNRLSICEAHLKELKQEYDYLDRNHKQTNLFISEVMA